ncbi:MAG: hypothetical protein QXZ41_08055 [Ignisphaera sp.]
MIKLNRRLVEEITISIGILGLIFVFQPFNNLLYAFGWILLMVSTFSYVIFTLIPRDLNGKLLIKSYFKTLFIVLLVVIAFTVLSILLIPVLIK